LALALNRIADCDPFSLLIFVEFKSQLRFHGAIFAKHVGIWFIRCPINAALVTNREDLAEAVATQE
jgi:hypothetical protein